LSFRLSKLCFEGPESELALTTNAQPALLVAGIAAFRVLRATTGLAPVLFAGHSLGEFSAAVAAGALRFRDAVVLVRRRGEFMQTAAPVGLGTMIAVMGADLEHLELLCRRCSEGEVLSPANYNGAGQVVVAGHTTAVARRSEEHTSELQSRENLVCRLLLEKKTKNVLENSWTLEFLLSYFCAIHRVQQAIDISLSRV